MIIGFWIDWNLANGAVDVWNLTQLSITILGTLLSFLVYHRCEKLSTANRLYLTVSCRVVLTCVTWTSIYNWIDLSRIREVTSILGFYPFWLSFLLKECTEFFYSPLLREPIVEYLLNDKFLGILTGFLEVVSLNIENLSTYTLISTISFLNSKLVFLDTHSLINLVDFTSYLWSINWENFSINLGEWLTLGGVILLTLTGGRLRLSIPWSETNEQTKEVTSINISNWRKILQGSYHVIDLLNNDNDEFGLYGRILIIMFYFLVKLMPFKSLLHDLRIKKVMVNERHISLSTYLECILRCAVIALLWAYMLRTVNSESTMIILRSFYVFFPIWDLLVFLKTMSKVSNKMEVRFSEILRSTWIDSNYA